MRTIGIRVSPSNIYFCIVESKDNEFEIMTCSNLIVPKALDIPSQLSFIRTCFISIIKEYTVHYAGIRIIESISLNVSMERIYIEGVIQELFANSTIEKHFIGRISKIAPLLKETSATIKEYISGEQVFGELDDWNSYNTEERESIITAVAATSL